MDTWKSWDRPALFSHLIALDILLAPDEELVVLAEGLKVPDSSLPTGYRRVVLALVHDGKESHTVMMEREAFHEQMEPTVCLLKVHPRGWVTEGIMIEGRLFTTCRVLNPKDITPMRKRLLAMKKESEYVKSELRMVRMNEL